MSFICLGYQMLKVIIHFSKISNKIPNLSDFFSVH